MNDISLLPRADLPVIWDAFKAKADEVRQIAETLTVTDVSQKEQMALARKTRLTLREIRIAVEHKRVELGEGHLKEIQKVNGVAKAIREFIEPLEARLLVQESFAERAEALRLGELAISRITELKFIRPNFVGVNLAEMSQEEYDKLLASLKHEKAELEAANRLRVEAERRLAESWAEQKRLNDEAEKRRQEEQSARKEVEARFAAERQEAEEKYRREQAEKDRIRDEQLAALEAELAKERAIKQAEADAARRLALAPDVERLRAYRQSVKDLPVPSGLAPAAESCFNEAIYSLAQGLRIIDQFCERNTI